MYLTLDGKAIFLETPAERQAFQDVVNSIYLDPNIIPQAKTLVIDSQAEETEKLDKELWAEIKRVKLDHINHLQLPWYKRWFHKHSEVNVKVGGTLGIRVFLKRDEKTFWKSGLVDHKQAFVDLDFYNQCMWYAQTKTLTDFLAIRTWYKSDVFIKNENIDRVDPKTNTLYLKEWSTDWFELLCSAERNLEVIEKSFGAANLQEGVDFELAVAVSMDSL